MTPLQTFFIVGALGGLSALVGLSFVAFLGLSAMKTYDYIYDRLSVVP